MRLTPFLLGRKAYTTIALDATVADIRSITRYSKQEWTVFKTVTASVAQALYGENDLAQTPTSRRLSSSEKRNIEFQVNALLKENGINNMPGERVLYWRLHRVFKNMRRMKTARLAIEAYVEENNMAGCAAELGPHMSRFKKLVRTEINNYASEHPDMTWTEIPNHVKNDIRDRVNLQLDLERIPRVGDDLMLQRMEMVLMYFKIRYNRERKLLEKEEVRGGEGEGEGEGNGQGEKPKERPIMPHVYRGFLKQNMVKEGSIGDANAEGNIGAEKSKKLDG